ncbi:MAG: biopolymer transporter ExbD [Gammaproteobacteria bacterium]|jgi:biopolymer transport protein ExbD
MAAHDELEDEEETEINLTPMLDVVFIMLIFFIVTAVFVKQPGIDIERPTALTREEPQGGAIYVAISPDGEIWIDGDEVELSGVRLQIERLHSENPEAGLIIQSDARARNENLIAVMDAAKAAGLSNVLIAAGEG